MLKSALSLKQGSEHKERKLQQRRLYFLLLILFFTFHVSCSHNVQIALPLVVAASNRRRHDIDTSRPHIRGAVGSRIKVTACKDHRNDKKEDKRIRSFYIAPFTDRKESKSHSSGPLRMNSTAKVDSKGTKPNTHTRGGTKVSIVRNDNNEKNGMKAAMISDRVDTFGVIKALVSSSLQENLCASKIIDFGCNTIRPVVGSVLLRLRQYLSQQGRGFGLACMGVQQIASMSRMKHINAALRLKQMEREAQENKYSVPESDMDEALRQGLLYQYGNNEAVLKKEGWKNVHSEKHFSLFKRRSSGARKGPVTYLMMGQIDDVTPRAFLKAQIIKAHRDKWDKTMASMESIKTSTMPMENGLEKCQDILYYRTKWPWPLKDRDYTLARRCKIIFDKRAIVFVSKSVNHPKALVDGALRVDKYWCHSTFFSNCENNKGKEIGGVKMFDKPGLSCVTIFCDDTNVALPASVIDLLSRHAEKTVPSSMKVLFDYSKNLT